MLADVATAESGPDDFRPIPVATDVRLVHVLCMRVAAPEPSQVPGYPPTFNAGRFRPCLSTHILGIIQLVESLETKGVVERAVPQWLIRMQVREQNRESDLRPEYDQDLIRRSIEE
jgi:hypothetical protein